MNSSNSIKELATALKNAQAQMGEVKFDSTNPFYKSKYASLGAVIQASKEVLAQNGLVISQPSITNEFGVGVRTVLMHESGEWMEDTITIPIVDQKNIAQEAGKIITYLRRYSLASMLNLYSDEDTDAEVVKNKQQENKQVEKSATERPLSPTHLKELIAAKAKTHAGKHISPEQNSLLVGMLELCFAGDGDSEIKRHTICKYLTDQASSKNIPANFKLALLDWLKPVKDDGGAYAPDKMAQREAQAALTQAHLDNGQQTLI